VKERVRIVTPEQKNEGYIRKVGSKFFSEQYIVIAKLSDGNYLVREPEDDA
jgi:hypothetical protein